MTLEETKQAAEVMAAFDPKKQNVQWTKRGHGDWQTVIAPGWDWANNEYRITPEPAPEPQVVKVWVHKSSGVISKQEDDNCKVWEKNGWTLHRALILEEVQP